MVVCFITLHRCCCFFFTNWRQDPLPPKKLRLALLWCSLYCSGLEPSPQDLQVMLIFVWWAEISFFSFTFFSFSTLFLYSFLPSSFCSLWHYWSDCLSFCFFLPPSFASLAYNRFRGNKRIEYLFHSHFINNTGSFLSVPLGNEKRCRRTFVTVEWWIHDDSAV